MSVPISNSTPRSPQSVFLAITAAVIGPRCTSGETRGPKQPISFISRGTRCIGHGPGQHSDCQSQSDQSNHLERRQSDESPPDRTPVLHAAMPPYWSRADGLGRAPLRLRLSHTLVQPGSLAPTGQAGEDKRHHAHTGPLRATMQSGRLPVRLPTSPR